MIIDRRILSRKYARAFLNIFKKEITPAVIQKIAKLVEFLNSHKQSEVYLRMSMISPKKKREVLLKIFAEFDLEHSALEKLLDVLLVKNRVQFISTILNQIVVKYNKQNNIVDAQFRYSHELDDETKKTISDFFQKKLGLHIVYKYILDKSLIAGVRLNTDTDLWEYSIRQQLEPLRRRCKG